MGNQLLDKPLTFAVDDNEAEATDLSCALTPKGSAETETPTATGAITRGGCNGRSCSFNCSSWRPHRLQYAAGAVIPARLCEYFTTWLDDGSAGCVLVSSARVLMCNKPY